MRSKKNQFLKYKMSYQETTKPAVSSNSYSSSSVQDMVQVNTMTTIHLINKLNTFTTPYLKSNHQPGEEEYKELENDIKTLDEQISQNTNDIELLDQKIDNLKGDLTADKYEWYAIDVSSEYDKTYNMKRAFNKYGDSFLIRSRATYTSGEYTIHECEVNTMYGPNIQYNFISDYVYIPSWIKDKDNDKILYHVVNCDFIMKNDTVNCSSKKFEFGEGWNRILVRYSSTLEYIKTNSDCGTLGIGNNSVLKNVDLIECYQLSYCEIANNPNITQIILQNRPTTLSVPSSIKTVILDELNESVTTINSSITTINSSITTLDSRVTTLENSTPSVSQTLFGPRYSTTPSDLSDLTAEFDIHDNYTNNDWHISRSECYYKGGYSTTIPKIIFPPCLKGYITQNLTMSAEKSGSNMLYNLDIDLSACSTRNLEFNGVTVSGSIVLPEFYLYYNFTTGSDPCNFSLNNASLYAQICEMKLNGQYIQFNVSNSSCITIGNLTKIQLVLTQCHKSRVDPIMYNGTSSNIFNVVKAWA